MPGFFFDRYNAPLGHLNPKEENAMNVLPQDLGEKRCEAIVSLRAGTVPKIRQEADEPLGFWGRRWLGRLRRQLSPKEVRPLLQAVRPATNVCAALGLLAAPATIGGVFAALNDYFSRPYQYHDPLPPFICLGVGGLWTWLFAIVQPRRILRKKYRRLYETPVSGAEVAALLPQTHDELERSYLTLVMDVSRQEVQTAGGANLRLALRSLGEAIDKLPATRVVVSDDHDIITEVLQRTAAETLRKAQEEPDRIAAASLIRRVEALHRRADATKGANTLTRRFSVLRQEMAAETEALRAGLTAYYSGAHEVADLTQLAEDMQRLAAEAAALTDAVEEVDIFTAGVIPVPVPSPASASSPAPVVNRVRLG